MTEQEHEHRTPFVLGTPIRNPADFYGREAVLRELFQAVLDGQLVSVVGEHRCGNTSVLYQLLHEDQHRRYLAPAEAASLVFAFLSAQLAAEGPEALLRRIARALRRADPEAEVDFDAPIDREWLENYLDNLTHRHKRLALLIDELEVLAELDPAFWEWFQGLVTEYDVSMVASTRVDLGQFRAEQAAGPPFFNMFRSVYIGSFRPETVEQFLQAKSELTGFDFSAVREVITDLAGRFPYYMQVASALIYVQAGGESHISREGLDTVTYEFKARTAKLFDDAWSKLPAGERNALGWLSLPPSPVVAEEPWFHQARQSLERRGYVLESRIFSSALRDYVRQHLRRVELTPRPEVIRVDQQLMELPALEHALLAFLLEHEGELVTEDELREAVGSDRPEITAATVREALDRLGDAIGGTEGSAVEAVPGQGFRLHNPALSLDE